MPVYICQMERVPKHVDVDLGFTITERLLPKHLPHAPHDDAVTSALTDRTGPTERGTHAKRRASA